MRTWSIVDCQLNTQHSVVAAQTGRIGHNATRRRAQTIAVLLRQSLCCALMEEQGRSHRQKNLLLQSLSVLLSFKHQHCISTHAAYCLEKSNIVIRSPTAGLLVGIYGLLRSLTGLGRLSRLRDDNGFSFQFSSINFIRDAWSP